MSINVTVSGNPVNINRGKMIAVDPNYEKQDFEKRRLMRLEQVRQQSKNIAENVRNKVRKEKHKQMKQIEKDGKEKLKSWQQKKLLELQNQYEDVLQEVGIGHKEAKEVTEQADIEADQRDQNREISKQRGRIAATKLQVEKNERSLKNNVSTQKKKIVTAVQNAQPSMVSNTKNGNRRSSGPSRKRKKTKADISITIPDSDSTSSEHSYEETDSDALAKSGESLCLCTDSSDLKIPLTLDEEKDVPTSNNQHLKSSLDFERPRPEAFSGSARQTSRKYRDHSPPLDTRISDRIKRRDVMASKMDYCDIASDVNPVPIIESNKNIRTAIDSRYNRNFPDKSVHDLTEPSENRCLCGGRKSRVNFNESVRGNKNMGCWYGNKEYNNFEMNKESHKLSSESYRICNSCGVSLDHRQFESTEEPRNHIAPKKMPSRQEQFTKGAADTDDANNLINRSVHSGDQNIQSKLFHNIPSKPPIRLKDVPFEDKSMGSTKTSLATTGTNKVPQYDHQNRLSSHIRKVPSGSQVEKITSESLEVIPNAVSEVEWYKKMQQRDREAQIRGQKALEKEKIQRDYEELMKKLPILRKKERISEISKDKAEYHMSEGRLQEKEKQKQNRLNNAYNDLFPNLKPAIVTLPRVNGRPKSPECPSAEPVHSINTAEWDVDYKQPKVFTSEEAQEIVDAYANQDPKVRQEKLKELLRSLKLQKEQLIEEMKRLPINDSVNELINDLKSFNEETKKSHRKKRKESKRKRCECSFDSTTSSISSSSMTIKDERRQRHSHDVARNSPSPRKKTKMKSKRKVLILQNTSTQTTPKAERNLTEENKIMQSDKLCEKLHVPCDCNKENDKTSAEEVCQILIKLNDADTSEVIVKSKEDADKIDKPFEKSPSKPSKHSVAVGTDNVDRSVPRKLSLKQIPKDIIDKLKDYSPTTSKGHIKDKPDKKVSKSTTVESRSRSWKDQLTRNSISTSSTSYWSPPDFERSKGIHSSTKTTPKSFYNLGQKPHQLNLEPSEGSFPHNVIDKKQLFTYVKQLLDMSRGSVDRLNVSSVSTVQTPSQSIIEVENNNPTACLANVIKFFNLNNQDLARELSYSPSQTAHFNTSASASERETQEKQTPLNDNGLDQIIPEKESSTSSKSKEPAIDQYANMTESCSKRIAALSEMIQKIRDEKIQMLQNPPAILNIEHPTSYMDLPDSKEGSSKHTSSSSLDEDEIYNKLMEIDHSLAAKLKKFSPAVNNVQDEKLEFSNDTNEELWARLQRLKNDDVPDTPTSVNSMPEPTIFVPFLSDIPKLPKFEPQPERFSNTSDNHKRPPPSKGLIAAKKFNGNISLVPHELSTIAEADSQISTRIGSTCPTPSTSRTNRAIDGKDIDIIIVPGAEVKTCNDATCEEKCLSKAVPSTDDKGYQDDTKCNVSSKLTSSSSTDDVENIEAMLRSIGMAWAIPTLYKTQEALALTSSSSSLEIKAAGNESACSEVSLKDFLAKQIWSKISSSTFQSDVSPESILNEFANLSTIKSTDRQRTSTPVRSSKSTSKSRDSLKNMVFSGDSEISSVRNDSESHSK